MSNQDVPQQKQTTVREGNTTQTTSEVTDPKGESEHRANIAERIVWLIAGVVLFLLGFRFILTLLGANTTNGFADFIYSTSQPFVSPFFSLFNYTDTAYGVSRLEIYTLSAMLFYLLVAFGIAKLVTISRD